MECPIVLDLIVPAYKKSLQQTLSQWLPLSRSQAEIIEPKIAFPISSSVSVAIETGVGVLLMLADLPNREFISIMTADNHTDLVD